MRQIPLTNQSDLPRPGRRFVTQPAKERTELRPVRGGGWRRCKGIQNSEVPAGSGEMRQRIPRRRRTDAWPQLQHAEGCDGVSRALDPAQHAQHVIDMRCLKELHPAVFDEWDAAARELDLELVAMVARAEQHRLT